MLQQQAGNTQLGAGATAARAWLRAQCCQGPPGDGVFISRWLYREATLPAATERCASCTAAHQLHAAAEEESPRGTDQHLGQEPLHAPRTDE